METKETYYEILGIDANSTEEDIRKAYRKQALLWHPDKNVHRKEEAEARFKLVAEAYEVLSDTEKRRIYDLYGEEGLKNGGPSYDSEPHFSFQAHDPFEIFNAFFGRDPFAGFGPPPFGFPPFGARPFGTGRSLFDNEPFFSNNFGGNFGGNFGSNFGGNFGGNLGGSSTSTFSFSSNSSFSGGGQSGYVKRSTSTQIVNGVRKTVTTTEDAQGNVTVVTETSDGERQVLVNNRPQALNDAPRNVMAIQDEVPYYQQQQQSQQPQRQQRQQHYYQQQQYQEPPSYQYQETQQYQESEPQHQSQEEDHSHHKKHFWQFKRR